ATLASSLMAFRTFSAREPSIAARLRAVSLQPLVDALRQLRRHADSPLMRPATPKARWLFEPSALSPQRARRPPRMQLDIHSASRSDARPNDMQHVRRH